MIVLVCGGRNYDNSARLEAVMDSYPDITLVVQGGGNGADYLAKQWSIRRGIHCAQVNALWNRFGKKAGAMRNHAMLTLKPDLVVAFPGGRGTEHMKKIAKRAGVFVEEIEDG